MGFALEERRLDSATSYQLHREGRWLTRLIARESSHLIGRPTPEQILPAISYDAGKADGEFRESNFLQQDDRIA